MFKNHKIEMRVVKEDPAAEGEQVVPVIINTKDFIEIIEKSSEAIVGGTVVIIGTVFLARTLEHVVVKILK